MIPDTLTAREVLAWVDAVIGHPMCYTAARLSIGISTVQAARAAVCQKLGYDRVNVALLVRAAYAVIRDR